MDFSPRLRQIVMILLNENRTISIKDLAEKIKVSKRTVQRELEYTGSSLKKYGLKLNTKTGVGIWLEGSEEDKQNLLNLFQHENVTDFADKDERRKRLILEILKDRTPKKLYYYSNIFKVSEATISSDMEAIAGWFEQFSLQIVRKQGYGVSLEGSEKNYRRAVREFLTDNSDSSIIKSLFVEQSLTPFDIIGNKEENTIYRLLDHQILNQVVLCFLSIPDKRIANLTENSYIGLILHVTIAIDRILKHEIIEPNHELIEKLHKDSDYELAEEIVTSLEKQFQVEIPNVEIAYIYLHIKGAKHQTADVADYGLGEPTKKEELLHIIYQLIDAYDPFIAYELKQDEEFIEGLVAHLQPTFVRLKNNMMIYNPLLDQIKESYADIFDKCVNVSSLLEEIVERPVPDAEIGFLVMHFGAALVRLENKKEVKRRITIGIVCASGIGISRLMLTRLNQFLKDRADLITYGKEDLTTEELERVDFFISSIPLDVSSADILMVSPLLPDRDLEMIDQKVKVYAKIPKETNKGSDFMSQLDRIHFISHQIRQIIKNFVYLKLPNDISFEGLLDHLSEQLGTSEGHQAIIKEDLYRREQIGTQIVPEYGFALLHTRTKGVDKPSFSVCLTEDLNIYKDPCFKKIYAVIVLLMPKDEYIHENKEILGALSSSLAEDEEFLKVIFDGQKEMIQGYLSKELKSYFNKCLEAL